MIREPVSILLVDDQPARLLSYEAILRDLGVESVALMTNNPLKVDGLEAAGMPVTRRVPHTVASLPEPARHYVEAKRRRMGHVIVAEWHHFGAGKTCASPEA